MTRENKPNASFFCQVLTSLFEINGVEYVGHRFGIPTLFVNRKLTAAETFDIETILLSGVNDLGIYDVLDVSAYRPLNSLCMVGSKIEKTIADKTKTGTLGCFLVRKLPGACEQICAVTAGHVADVLCCDNKMAGTLEFKISGTDVKIEERSLLRCSSTTDIAAFVINDDIKNKLRVKGKFKTRDNIKKECLLHNWSEKKFKDSFAVYIHGASTDVGTGIVTSPDLVAKDMQPYVYIEDDDTDINFSQPGDSGSVICFDNDNETHISAVALLIGHLLDQPHYIGLKLDFGINELSKRYGAMTLCDNV